MVPRLADEEVTELAKVDQAAHEDFGRDEGSWTPPQWRRYFADIDAIHAQFPHEQVVA
jgi:hypothetical protein